MRGRSVEILREAGVEVEVLDDPDFERQNEQFLHQMRTGRPFVHVKLADDAGRQDRRRRRRQQVGDGGGRAASGPRAAGRGRRRARRRRHRAGGRSHADGPRICPRSRRPSPGSCSTRASRPAPIASSARTASEGAAARLRGRGGPGRVGQRRSRASGVEVVGVPTGAGRMDLAVRPGRVGTAWDPGRARRGRRERPPPVSWREVSRTS